MRRCAVGALALVVACLRTYALPAVETTGTETGPSSEASGAPDCDPPLFACGEQCVNVDEHPEHCGDCFDECFDETECIEGFCQRPCDGGCDEVVEECDFEDELCLCRPGLSRCSGVCVNERNSHGNCGECGNECNPNQLCIEGFCVAEECPESWDECDGGCAQAWSDALNCGACGRECLIDELCFDGRCIPAYPEFGCECPCGCEEDGAICCFSEFTESEVCVFDDNAC